MRQNLIGKRIRYMDTNPIFTNCWFSNSIDLEYSNSLRIFETYRHID